MPDKESNIKIGLCYPLANMDSRTDTYNLLKKSIKLADEEGFQFFWTLDMAFKILEITTQIQQ